MQRHFRDLHPQDKVIVWKEEGRSYPQCRYCQMQINPMVTGHWKIESYLMGAVTLTLALRCIFQVHGDVLERVKVFKYLGCLLAQDSNDVQAVHQQLCKVRTVWAHIG